MKKGLKLAILGINILIISISVFNDKLMEIEWLYYLVIIASSISVGAILLSMLPFKKKKHQ
ncbi:hypothetical protein JV173_01825 [Acholeplasma equirhinis]|uniref:hypothetical protein n=1 Tax=Acholeplasma equirhinis TaxID=555393 RepID=UPI00197AF370|nr:hypothetical protein [Acholeplasma equirhinis]MBN3490243.1 hypothetical protein [Acholeplasma equirhinis]